MIRTSTRKKLEDAIAADGTQTLDELAKHAGVSRGRVAQLLESMGFVHNCKWVRRTDK